jgi:GntR family transcriptional regulator
MSLVVRDELLKLFEAENMHPGDRLPSETAIAERCGVGRSTVREALKLLEQSKVITVERGRGWYLSSLNTLKVERPVTRYESVTEMLSALGYRTRAVVLAVTEATPSEGERDALDLAAGSQVIRLERLRLDTRDDPLMYTVDVIPRECIPAPIKHIDWTGSLNELLAAHGYLAVSSAARLQAVELPEDVSDRYSLGNLGPWLLITETAVTATGQRVLYAQDYHRGDAFAFNVLRE